MIDIASGRDGSLRVQLDEAESALLQRLVSDVRALVERRDTDDPVDRRLFPKASESPEEAKAFKALAEEDLVAGKLEALDAVARVLHGGGDVDATLPPDDVERWLRALTDLRLAIGVRLGVDDGAMTADPDPHDPHGAMMLVLHWLGAVQETMLAEIGSQAP